MSRFIEVQDGVIINVDHIIAIKSQESGDKNNRYQIEIYTMKDSEVLYESHLNKEDYNLYMHRLKSSIDCKTIDYKTYQRIETTFASPKSITEVF